MPQDVEGLTRPPRSAPAPPIPRAHAARTEGVDVVLFGKPPLVLGIFAVFLYKVTSFSYRVQSQQDPGTTLVHSRCFQVPWRGRGGGVRNVQYPLPQTKALPGASPTPSRSLHCSLYCKVLITLCWSEPEHQAERSAARQARLQCAQTATGMRKLQTSSHRTWVWQSHLRSACGWVSQTRSPDTHRPLRGWIVSQRSKIELHCSVPLARASRVRAAMLPLIPSRHDLRAHT